MQIIKKWLLVDINWTGTDYLVSNQAATQEWLEYNFVLAYLVVCLKINDYEGCVTNTKIARMALMKTLCANNKKLWEQQQQQQPEPPLQQQQQ